MELENSFVVPAGIEAAWAKLLDVESMAPCMPGAALTSHDGDEFAGTVKVKLGPVSMVYNGTARFAEQDPTAHRAVIEAAGKDTKATSTARATVQAQLTAEAADRTRVDVVTDLAITGRPAQFGRGVMQDVAGRIIDQFAANLAHLIAGGAEPAEAPEGAVAAPAKKASRGAKKVAAAPVDAPGPAATALAESTSEEAPSSPTPAAGVSREEMPFPDDAIDLIDSAATPVLKRVLPVLAGLVVLWVVWRIVRRRG